MADWRMLRTIGLLGLAIMAVFALLKWWWP